MDILQIALTGDTRTFETDAANRDRSPSRVGAGARDGLGRELFWRCTLNARYVNVQLTRSTPAMNWPQPLSSDEETAPPGRRLGIDISPGKVSFPSKFRTSYGERIFRTGAAEGLSETTCDTGHSHRFTSATPW